MIQILVAVDKNWGIGRDNKLLLTIPADMNYFRKCTTGNVVIMGRKTLESFPGGRPLPNRTNIIVSSNENYTVKGSIVVNSIEEALEKAKEYEKDIYIIGGESIYRQMLEYAEIAHVTYIDYSYAADAHFINLDEEKDWELSEESEEQTHCDISYYFRKYTKKQ